MEQYWIIAAGFFVVVFGIWLIVWLVKDNKKDKEIERIIKAKGRQEQHPESKNK
jgi:uncharacterized membrane protein